MKSRIQCSSRWLGKAKHKHILLQFIIICVIVALLFLGTVIYLSQPV